MKDVRFYYGFFVEVSYSMPFEDIYDDVLEYIDDLLSCRKIEKALIYEDWDNVNIVVVGGSPKIWHELNAKVYEIDSTIASRFIDMFGSKSRSYIVKEIEKK